MIITVAIVILIGSAYLLLLVYAVRTAVEVPEGFDDWPPKGHEGRIEIDTDLSEMKLGRRT